MGLLVFGLQNWNFGKTLLEFGVGAWVLGELVRMGFLGFWGGFGGEEGKFMGRDRSGKSFKRLIGHL